MAYDCSVPIISAGESFRGIKAEEGIPVVFEGGSLDKAHRFTIGTISPELWLWIGNEAYIYSGVILDGRYLYRIGKISTYTVLDQSNEVCNSAPANWTPEDLIEYKNYK